MMLHIVLVTKNHVILVDTRRTHSNFLITYIPQMGSIPFTSPILGYFSTHHMSARRSLRLDPKQRWCSITCKANSSKKEENNNVADDDHKSSSLMFENKNGCFVNDAQNDPNCPSNGSSSSIDQAIASLKEGKFVIVVDDENKQGNLVMAASSSSSQAIAFMVKHGSGMISVGMTAEDLERLNLPLISSSDCSEDTNSSAPTFTVTVDAKVGTTTGVSAKDRATTIKALASPDSKPGDFRKPGHVFPLKYRNGGVLIHKGQTEASVDLVMLAGLRPVSIFSTIIDHEDGSAASSTALQKLASEHDIPVVSISDLIRYKTMREILVVRTAISRLPTKWGRFQAYGYRSKLDGIEHIAIVKGSIGNGEDILVRVHSECLTGDVFGSARCDCGPQLDLALQMIEKEGRGVVLYLRGHEGRGIGLGHKLQAYNLQDLGHDTVEANLQLGLAADARDYGVGALILRDIGVRTLRLMTNNPAKLTGLNGYGLTCVGRVPVMTPITEENKRYLETKRTRMGHIYGTDIKGSFMRLIDSNNSSN